MVRARWRSGMVVCAMVAAGGLTFPPCMTVARADEPPPTWSVSAPTPVPGKTYYVRQTVGKDSNDGLSPQTAWEHVGKLSTAMHAGDLAYVGPGLYREEITVLNDGTPDARIVFIADVTGQQTGDPPGVVMLAGADPVDESIFAPDKAPGVYKAPMPNRVVDAVEMDGDQYRYRRAEHAGEFLGKQMAALQVVEKYPSTLYYDEAAKVLYLHTSDGKPPSTHEIELVRRGSGISAVGKNYVTVVGFTIRHVGDGGIIFFRGAGNGIAINNTSYGNRQGIRVYTASNILVYGNTLFRNENSGVYFAGGSVDGKTIGNALYENIKGVRWSSQSRFGMAIDNAAFDNLERGISIEHADDNIVRGNRLVNNAVSQLLIIQSTYTSENNCFENGKPEQLTADFFFVDRYKTLAEYQQAKHEDLHSRFGNCGPLPTKIDVHKLHADTLAYTEQARRILAAQTPTPTGTATRAPVRASTPIPAVTPTAPMPPAGGAPRAPAGRTVTTH